MLYPSTDFIWGNDVDGLWQEHDIPRPTSLYGQTKLAGEKVVLRQGIGCVARFSLLYGAPACPRGSTWTWLMESFRAGAPVSAAIDEFRTPVSLADAARVVIALGRRKHVGLVHVAGPEVLSPYEMFDRLARSLGLEANLRPISRNDLVGEVVRPRNMAMDGTALLRLLPAMRPGPISAGSYGRVRIECRHQEPVESLAAAGKAGQLT